jgi:hypothetical protein
MTAGDEGDRGNGRLRVRVKQGKDDGSISGSVPGTALPRHTVSEMSHRHSPPLSQRRSLHAESDHPKDIAQICLYHNKL